MFYPEIILFKFPKVKGRKLKKLSSVLGGDLGIDRGTSSSGVDVKTLLLLFPALACLSLSGKGVPDRRPFTEWL